MNVAPLGLPSASVPFSNDSSMLQSLPEELVRIVLSYNDVSALVRFAGTCTHHRRLIYKETPMLWKEIDFEKVACAGNLSDTDLHALLTNVNARNVTTSLSLMGCTNVCGQGLEPLRESQKLEIIELRRSKAEIETMGGTGLDDAFVIGVLSSMSPINKVVRASTGLKLVKIRKQYDTSNFFASFEARIRWFLLTLDRAIAEKAREQRISCKQCKCALVDKIPSKEFEWRAAMSFCSGCKTYQCGEDDCDFIMECNKCMGQFCYDCKYVASCNDCGTGTYYCHDCKVIGFCSACEKSHCFDCRFTSYCDICDDSFCHECRDVLHCGGCDKTFCEKCRDVYSCEGCHDHYFCSECLVECQSCKLSFCHDCTKEKNESGNCKGCCAAEQKRASQQQDGDAGGNEAKRPRLS